MLEPALARVARPDVGVDILFHADKAFGDTAAGAQSHPLEETGAAGTCQATIAVSPPKTIGGGKDGGRGCQQGAGARVSQAEIRFARHQQRHQPYPEDGPENHATRFPATHEIWRLIPCRALKPFFKFETNAVRVAQISPSSTTRC